MAGEGEFEFIARRLAPLARDCPGAYGLQDDGAILRPPAGDAYAVTSDTLVEGVHFPDGEDPHDAAWKALAANVSDLVALAARPEAYLLNVVWPRDGYETRVGRFLDGLTAAQARFGLSLAGGDTTSADGPWMISITAFGIAPGGATPRRGAAKAGDLVFVSNQIGDPWLGLQRRLGAVAFEDAALATLADRRFSAPVPPVELISALQAYAAAAIDVSDGLLADLGHILEASGLGASIDLGDMPLSPAGQDWVSRQDDAAAARLALATGGDDYQVVAAVRPEKADAFRRACAAAGSPVSQIAVLEDQPGLRVSLDGRPLQAPRRGFTHF